MSIKNHKKKLFQAIGEDTDKAFKLIEELLDQESNLYPVFLVRKGNWKSIKKDLATGILEKYSRFYVQKKIILTHTRTRDSCQ